MGRIEISIEIDSFIISSNIEKIDAKNDKIEFQFLVKKEDALKISSEVFRQEGRDKKGRPIFMIKPDKDNTMS